MKRAILSLIAACAITSAHAAGSEFRTIVQDGGWSAKWGYSDSGKAMCLMDVHNRNYSQSVIIKWLSGEERLLIHAFKDTWRIPRGTQVPVELGFDRKSFATAKAFGGMSTSGQSGMVEFTIVDRELAIDFLAIFREADQMWIKFPSGNETPWIANMTGSRTVGIAFAKCIGQLGGWQKLPTQPYANEPTQPYSNTAPTQPQRPTQPFPAPKRSPVPNADSI